MDAKAKRYDRQIRVWGTHGQQRLEQAKVCVLNCGPTGCETLKNLVLAGIGAFTVVDGARVQASDLGNNFLVGPENLGRPRAQVVTELLKELNDSVAGSFVEETPEDLIRSDPQFFGRFTLIVATQVNTFHLVTRICRLSMLTSKFYQFRSSFCSASGAKYCFVMD